MNFDSPGDIRELLTSLDAAPRKKWGQNFMINRGAREAILQSAGNVEGLHAWEVGGGLGALTDGLVHRCARVTVFEVDPIFARHLRTRYHDIESFMLLEGNVLSTWREALRSRGMPDVVVGNLPYGIAQRLLVDLVTGGLRPRRIVCTVQKEVAQRATARPGTKDYSAFTVLLAVAYVPRVRMVLRAGSFWPPPEVESAIIELDRLEGAATSLARLVVPLVRAAFQSRRKKLANAIKTLVRLDASEIGECLEAVGVSREARGEALSADDFVRLAAALERRCPP